MKCNVTAADQHKAPSRLIADYAVCETLGSGAFGTVYKVRKQTGQTFLAMKEASIWHFCKVSRSASEEATLQLISRKSISMYICTF